MGDPTTDFRTGVGLRDYASDNGPYGQPVSDLTGRVNDIRLSRHPERSAGLYPESSRLDTGSCVVAVRFPSGGGSARPAVHLPPHGRTARPIRLHLPPPTRELGTSGRSLDF